MTYRVLSMDGGGIRGLISVILMQRLNQEPGLENWLSQVDLLAGTSTGGLLALAIARGLDLQVIRDLYEKKGAEVFDDSWLDDVLDLGTLIGAQYHIKNLSRELRRILGSTTLGELSKSVLITTFDLDNEAPDPSQRTWKPKLFHNLPGEGNDDSWLAYEVGLYTAAAPTYFPSVDGFIDGGVYANNPSMCALAQTQDSRNAVQPAARGGGAALAGDRHLAHLYHREEPGLGLRPMGQAAGQPDAGRGGRHRRLPVQTDAGRAATTAWRRNSRLGSPSRWMR